MALENHLLFMLVFMFRHIPTTDICESSSMWKAYKLPNESGVSLVKSTLGHFTPQEPRDVPNKSECHKRRRRKVTASSWPIYLTAHWRLYAWSYLFSATVLALQLGFGGWQCYKYSTNEAVRAAFGWGVPVAKFGAGALYPTFFFLILSMSRWLATVGRYFGIHKYLNWDRHRYFHIRMAVMALVFSLLHTFGHVSGTVPTAVQPGHHDAVESLLGSKMRRIDWLSFILSRPGWTGISALLMFLIITTFSLPAARKVSFEAFQIVHLLIFPMLVLLALHGTAALLQYPALGFVTAGPLIVILGERIIRAVQIMQRRVARITPIGNDCVEVTVFVPGAKRRRFYRPGQYILVRVPRLSRFQWHPFTVVRATDSELVIIAKNNGSWTGTLQQQDEFTIVNLDGPFSAPCQGFWDYDHNILIGMGTGLTPSAAIINELLSSPTHPWIADKKGVVQPGYAQPFRKRVMVIWVVRDAALLDTFAPLLTSMLSQPQHECLDLSCHVYISRSTTPLQVEGESVPEVCSNGRSSRIKSYPGKRPSFVEILRDHHQEFSMELRETTLRTGEPRTTNPKVGVFFCGSAIIKAELREMCLERTVQGVIDGSDLEYHFHPEVF